MLTISDSVALTILNDEILLAGVGNEIHMHTTSGNNILPFKLKGKVHGIVSAGTSKKVLVYGEHEFILIAQTEKSFQLLYRGLLSDWISSGKILEKPNSFVIVTAHSVAILFKYDDSTKSCKIEEKSSCTDKSTLYCSFIYGTTWEQLLVLGGNAFGELLVWQPLIKTSDNCDKARLLHRTPGHNGVIFSIDIDIESSLLVTTSDDRSIRFWEVSTFKEDDGSIDFKRSTFIPMKSGYSHVARVFIGKIIHENGNTYAITGGEDSYICLWNQNCDLLFKRRQQFGATIWSLAYHSPTFTVFTTGSDGSILKYDLQECFNQKHVISPVLKSQILDSSEYIAKIKFLGEKGLIGVTNKNRIMHRRNFEECDWVEVEDFVRFKCTVLEVYESYIALAGYQRITLFKAVGDFSVIKKIYDEAVLPGVIRSFIFLSHNKFLISDEYGNCKLINPHKLNDFLSIELPQCKERWITAACLVGSEFLVVSNRQGNLMLFNILEDGSSAKLCDTLKRLHGHLGATTIHEVVGVGSYYILNTSGHDNTIKTIKLDKEKQQLIILTREIIPIAWVVKTILCHNDLKLIIGFNDNHFVVWSREMDTHFEIPCGGGHRCWDLKLQLSKNQASMIFVKNKQVLLHKETVFNKSAMSLNIPSRNKWHVRPCNILNSFRSRQQHFFVSGGDDNILKIFRFDLSDRKLEQRHEIHSHISNIRGLRVYTTVQGKHFIFSCGGRAQICVTAFEQESTTVEELVDYTIQKEKPSQDIRFDPETRVMSIDVRELIADGSFEIFVGCSDGYVRKFIMHENIISFVSEVFYGKCILNIRIAGDYFLTAATDGVVCFWKIEILEIIFKVPHHESGINSFDVRIIDEVEFHLLTGGDDQQVVYSKVIHCAGAFEISTLHRMDYLHTSQVTAVKFSPCLTYFYSSSVDQIVRRVDLKTFQSLWEVFSCVADVKGIELVQSCDSSNLVGFVYGCGLQLLDLVK